MSVSGGDSYTLVALAGESDVYTYDQLRGALQAEAGRGTPLLVVDLSGLEFMDSTGVQDQPWFVLTSPAGKIVWTHDGWLSPSALQAAAAQHG